MKVEKQTDDALENLGEGKRVFFKIKYAIIFLLILSALFVALRSYVYSVSPTGRVVRAVTYVIPFPAVKLDGTTITIKKFLIEHDALVNYFTQQDDAELPPPSELEQTVLNTMINKMVIEKLAKRYEVLIDAERVEEFYANMLSQEESEEVFLAELENSFGWTKNEFKTRLIEPIVLSLQTNDAILMNQELQAPRRNIIDSAYERVLSGEEFSLVAKDIFQDSWGQFVSDLGYISSSSLPVAWREFVEELSEGEISSVVDFDQGFVIFKVQERIKTGEEEQIHLSVISVPKETLEDAVKSYLAAANIKKYIARDN